MSLTCSAASTLPPAADHANTTRPRFVRERPVERRPRRATLAERRPEDEVSAPVRRTNRPRRSKASTRHPGPERAGSVHMSATEVTTTVGKMSVSNEGLLAWVREMAAMCEPDRVVWVDGSAAEKEALTAQAVAEGVLTPSTRRSARPATTPAPTPTTWRASSTSPSSVRRRRMKPGPPTTGADSRSLRRAQLERRRPVAPRARLGRAALARDGVTLSAWWEDDAGLREAR
jgi:hypothetical protein